tara:strand:- start:2327 stop:4102 length:1776 start_codon:yes stop_codon:yes gene_type:complete
MAKKFKKHMMYGPKGKSKMANTHKEHLALKNKGYGHTKSPLKINQALIENYKGVNKYTRTGGGTRMPEMDVKTVDSMFKPMAATASQGLEKSFLNQKPPKQEEETTPKEEATPKKSTNTNLVSEIIKEDLPKINDKDAPIIDGRTRKQKREERKQDKIEQQIKKEQEKLDKKDKEQQGPNLNDNFDKTNYELRKNKSLTLEQNTLAGDPKPTRLRVRSVFDKGRRNDNVVEVNGQRMSNEDFQESFGTATRRGSDPNRKGPGDYDFQGSLAPNSPFKKREDDQEAYDPLTDLQMRNPNIEREVDTYIENTSLVGDEKLDILGAQANSRVFDFSKQLKDQANMYIESEGNSKVVNDSINTLRGLAQKVNNLVDKKAEWIENNGGGEAGKRGFSKGSSGKNKFMQNSIFTERDDLYKMILPLPEQTVSGDTKFGDIEFAFGDFNDGQRPNAVVKSGQIFKDVFMKPEGKFADFRKAAVKQGENSRDRKPFNAYHAEVVVNGLLDSKENVLAFAWDDFAGPSFIDQYSEARPNEDISWADVDDPKFSEDRLKKEVGYWLNQKLKTEHEMTKANNQAMSYLDKMSPDELIAKYSK